MNCAVCGDALTGKVWSVGMKRNLCEQCADNIVACDHETGDQQQRYDADGCGFRVWVCSLCEGEWFDPY